MFALASYLFCCCVYLDQPCVDCKDLANPSCAYAGAATVKGPPRPSARTWNLIQSQNQFKSPVVCLVCMHTTASPAIWRAAQRS